MQRKLFPRHGVSRSCPGGRLLQLYLSIEQQFCGGIVVLIADGQCNGSLLSWRRSRQGEVSAVDDAAILQHIIVQREVVEIQEVVAVRDGKFMRILVVAVEVHILVDVLGNIELCRPLAVGSDDTIIQTGGDVVLVRTGEVIARHQLIEAVLLRPCFLVVRVYIL